MTIDERAQEYADKLQFKGTVVKAMYRYIAKKQLYLDILFTKRWLMKHLPEYAFAISDEKIDLLVKQLTEDIRKLNLDE